MNKSSRKTVIFRSLLAAAAWLAVSSATTPAAALLIEKAPAATSTKLTHFHPYRTSYRFVDPRYAFDDDPLTAFVHEPYFMPVVTRRVDVRRSMVVLRSSFVSEMFRSTNSI